MNKLRGFALDVIVFTTAITCAAKFAGNVSEARRVARSRRK